MRVSILVALVCPLAALASCSAAETGDNAPGSTPAAAQEAGPVDGELVELGTGSPFEARRHGTFDEPWAIAIEPGTGNIFITEKRGTAKFVQPGNDRLGFVESGLPDVAYGGQGGLGDWVFAPDYESSKAVYLSWAQAAGGEARRAVVGRGTLVCEEHDSCRIDDLRVIWRQEPAVTARGHFSHRIAFSPDGRHLYVSSGDRQQGGPAQDLSNTLGSIVRLNLDGTPAAGNPFAGRGAPTEQIWSYGHRNVLGLAFDRQGQLWGLEHGPKGGDELNKIARGANYGWPERSGGINYDNTPIPDHAPGDGFAHPAIEWTPVIAPGDFLFYRGSLWPEWQGQAVIANLASESIVRVALSADGGREVARHRFPKRLRDIAEAPDGSLWVIEDGEGGRLLHLTPRR